MTDKGIDIQVCTQCGHVNYPEREVCGNCLSDALEFQQQSNKGRLLSYSHLHHSHIESFKDRLPISIASVKLAAGPVVIAFLGDLEPALDQEVELKQMRDSSGHTLLEIEKRL